MLKLLGCSASGEETIQLAAVGIDARSRGLEKDQVLVCSAAAIAAGSGQYFGRVL